MNSKLCPYLPLFRFLCEIFKKPQPPHFKTQMVMTPLQRNTLYTLIALAVLFCVAACGDDFKNPFSGDDAEVDEIATDTASADSDTPYYEDENQGTTDSLSMENGSEESLGEEENSRESGAQKVGSQPQPTGSGTSESGRRFRVIIASVPQARAEKLLSEMNDPQVEIAYVQTLDTYRVVYRSFDDLGRAQAAAEAVRQRFPGAWIDYF